MTYRSAYVVLRTVFAGFQLTIRYASGKAQQYFVCQGQSGDT